MIVYRDTASLLKISFGSNLVNLRAIGFSFWQARVPIYSIQTIKELCKYLYSFFRMASSPPLRRSLEGEVLFGLVTACVAKTRAAWEAVRPSIMGNTRDTDELIRAMEGSYASLENNFFRVASMRASHDEYIQRLEVNYYMQFSQNPKKLLTTIENEPFQLLNYLFFY